MMNHNSQIVAAVDIGTTKIIAIVGRKNAKGKFEILGIGEQNSTGVKRGVVLNIDETAQAIQLAVNEAEEVAKIKFQDVYVGIAGQHIKSLRSKNYCYIDNEEGEIKRKDVDYLIADMFKMPLEVGEEIIHVIPQSYSVDNETGVKQPVGMSGKRLEGSFHIVVGQTASARNIQKCVARTGLQVNKLILEPLASAMAVLTEDEKEAGVALVDIGGGTTDIAVFYDGIIQHTAVIPFGGNVVTNDIKTGCNILIRYAENLKREYGSAIADLADENKVVTIPGINGRESKEISFKSLAAIIQARMEEIIDAIHFELESSGYIDKLSAGIALTGGGAMLKHLPQLIKYKIGLDVRLGFPNINLVAETDDRLNHPRLSTSIGLILKGAQYKQIDIETNANSKTAPVEEPELLDDELIDDKEEPIQEKKEKSGGFFRQFKETILDIFDDKDTSLK
jgi:cell division protein FtsA